MASNLLKRNQIKNLAKKILAYEPQVIALEGPLGAGKTTFTQQLAKELGIFEEVTSPTFVLHTEYRIPACPAGGPNTEYHLHHIDLWRMETFDELLQIGFAKMLKPGNIVVIEWADKFRSQILDFRSWAKIVWIKISYSANGEERVYENISY